MIEIRRYLSISGKDIFGEWLAELKDTKARAIINARIARISAGNFGDAKYLSDGVYEIRVDFGPGYRVYYGKHGSKIILLLCAGSKATQSKDINKAIQYYEDYKEREGL